MGHVQRFDHVGVTVADLDAALATAADHGHGMVGTVGEYRGAVRMACVRGPEGIVVSLFEQLG